MKKSVLLLLTVLTVLIASCVTVQEVPTQQADTTANVDTSAGIATDTHTNDDEYHDYQSQDAFLKLVADYKQMSAKNVAAYYGGSHQNALAWLRGYTAVGIDIFYKACQGDMSLTFYGQGCQETVQDRQAYEGTQQMQQFLQIAATQQELLPLHVKCVTGEVSGSSCDVFNQPALQQVTQQVQAPTPVQQQVQQQMPQATNFEQFVNTFDQMSAGQVLAGLQSLSGQERQWLEIYSYLGFEVYLRACGADGSLVFQGKNCQMLYEGNALTQQYGGSTEWLQDRQKLQIMFKCSRGELDAQSCQAYAGQLGNINTMQHDTSMGIINNLPTGTCRRYVDPNCY